MTSELRTASSGSQVVLKVPLSTQSSIVILEGKGYEVITAKDGQEALKKVSVPKPDLIILDIIMPKMNGFEVCKKLKSDPETASIPILMFTVLGRDKDREQGLKAGADDYLIKPFSAEELINIIKNRLSS
ncbi:MAG: response regulator [Nitrososphaerales archaeon]|nr:response regulator [Nitrososphaerales archaeon]